ncbi:hypothetical protein B14911_20673 [Bacillus sp. NRRL B-14911]|uniref:Uncharacterized protein n=1 Tax=Bacillus infantis NRRL B-14911 TaxID=1367477 RepID=U5L689_9BACI|nr:MULTISPECIES: hypothetical protein [Bacillus]AGX03339.1 hypothetical protein N288_07040 [Bacillus infantis NRRL B-14911]EAR64016.1 hypothetical protein B14911_20673 [Bacillus sp. NRRL B-14911]
MEAGSFLLKSKNQAGGEVRPGFEKQDVNDISHIGRMAMDKLPS